MISLRGGVAAQLVRDDHSRHVDARGAWTPDRRPHLLISDGDGLGVRYGVDSCNSAACADCRSAVWMWHTMRSPSASCSGGTVSSHKGPSRRGQRVLKTHPF